MHIMVVGMNHTTASVELRERVSMDQALQEHVLKQLRSSHTVMESVVLSTCNRTEIYALVNSVRSGQDYLLTLLAGVADMEKQELERYTFAFQGEQAVTHAMRVASGLESVVVGETQILGQMRHAFQEAFEAGNTGALFNKLFREVIHIGKRAQSETTVGQSPVSVSYAAVQLAAKILGDLSHFNALVIGAGHMGTLAAQHLAAQGIEQLHIANRTVERATELAKLVGGHAMPLTDLATVLPQVDVVVSATGASGFTITDTMVTPLFKGRKQRPIVFIDIAMPRDIDPNVAELPGMYLYDVDDLNGVVDANVEERKRQAAIIEGMIGEAVRDFSTWLAQQEVVPLIAALRAKGQAIQADVMASLTRKLPNLTEREQKLLNKHTLSIVNQLLRDPIQNVKELALASGDTEYVMLFAQLFGIASDEVKSHISDVDNQQVGGSFVELFQRIRGDGNELAAGDRALHPVLR